VLSIAADDIHMIEIKITISLAIIYKVVKFKDLQKQVQVLQSNPEHTQLLDRLRNRPFWI
jgi:hypothetical protein